MIMRFVFNHIRNKNYEYLYSAIVVICISGICYALSGFLGYRVVALILLLSVSLLAITFQILPVLLAAALSAFIWDFFFIPPRFTIHVHTTEDTILLIMYFVIAMINAVLTYKIRQAEKVARLKEERANSVKLYNTVLNSLSHELRTPLAAIIGATDNLLLNKNLSRADKDQLILEISKASLRINQQVENLLNISRLESGHIQPKTDWCDIIEIVYHTVQQVEDYNPGRKINISIKQNLPICKIDKGMLEQIIYNLLQNAAIHTEQNCRIDIAANCHGDLLEIIVEDNGHGFATAGLRNAVDKFSRNANPKTSGSGLGLSIVKGFTEALGGTVSLGKTPGGGTRCVLCLPVRIMSHTLQER